MVASKAYDNDVTWFKIEDPKCEKYKSEFDDRYREYIYFAAATLTAKANSNAVSFSAL